MAEGEAKVSLSDHADTAVVFLVLVTVFVCATMAVGRVIGNKMGWSGVTTFFGG